VFRTRFTVSAQDLSAPAVELWFGRINGGGSIYLNGQKIGDTGDSRAATIYDVKTLLHPGENTIAVPLANWGVTAGLNRGVLLHLQGNSAPVQWRRSAFNGLAQIIVQSTRQAGVIRLTASSAGLAPAVVSLGTTPRPPRPTLP
jgi:beta-galactosidase